jgi:DMSO/TMAO reductase YedYZ molybdopterin-dependent catalytic subunit
MTLKKKGENLTKGGSIPITKALNSEVLLAYEMNGEPLTLTNTAEFPVPLQGGVHHAG